MVIPLKKSIERILSFSVVNRVELAILIVDWVVKVALNRKTKFKINFGLFTLQFGQFV